MSIRSLSARRAWIEMRLADMSAAWNRVALRKESVDRNSAACSKKIGRLVALRKESVDRNGLGCCYHRDDVPSLSARRAWIEILVLVLQVCLVCVALRKESVDRNTSRHSINSMTHVALRKESVDRNWCPSAFSRLCLGRSPQGERG